MPCKKWHDFFSEERECLLLDDYSNKSLNIDLAEDSASENDENDIVFCSDGEESGSSTDIDLIVEEYREGLKVSLTIKEYIVYIVLSIIKKNRIRLSLTEKQINYMISTDTNK